MCVLRSITYRGNCRAPVRHFLHSTCHVPRYFISFHFPPLNLYFSKQTANATYVSSSSWFDLCEVKSSADSDGVVWTVNPSFGFRILSCTPFGLVVNWVTIWHLSPRAQLQSWNYWFFSSWDLISVCISSPIWSWVWSGLSWSHAFVLREMLDLFDWDK